MDFKWKWLIFVVLTLHYSLDVSGLQCIICIDMTDEQNCMNKPPEECATEADVMKIDMLVKDIAGDMTGKEGDGSNNMTGKEGDGSNNMTDNSGDGSNNMTDNSGDGSNMTATVRRSVGRQKRAQGYVAGQDPGCARYEGVTSIKPDIIYTIYSCTSLSPDIKPVSKTIECDPARTDMKISGVDFTASQCYCKTPPDGQTCFMDGPVIETLPTTTSTTPPPPGGSGGTTNPDDNTGGHGSNVRASVGLLLGAIGLFGFHQIQGVQPAL